MKHKLIFLISIHSNWYSRVVKNRTHLSLWNCFSWLPSENEWISTSQLNDGNDLLLLWNRISYAEIKTWVLKPLNWIHFISVFRVLFICRSGNFWIAICLARDLNTPISCQSNPTSGYYKFKVQSNNEESSAFLWQYQEKTIRIWIWMRICLF